MTNHDQLPLFSPEGTLHRCPTCDGAGVISAQDLKRKLEDRPGSVGGDHPETSQRAAHRPSNVIRFASQRYRVLAALMMDGPMTAAEVAVKVGLSRNQTATRLGECREIGYVTYARDATGAIVLRSTGPTDEGRVQSITPAGALAVTAATPQREPAE